MFQVGNILTLFFDNGSAIPPASGRLTVDVYAVFAGRPGGLPRFRTLRAIGA